MPETMQPLRALLEEAAIRLKAVGIAEPRREARRLWADLQGRSRAVSHDGSGYAFYEMLKRGHIYVGYYARPFHEVVKVYETLRSGQLP